MYKPFHLVPADTKIDFIRFHKPAFILSVLMVIGSIVLIFTKGLNYGIDFAGGVLMEVQSKQEQVVDLSALRGQLDGLEIGEITLQTFGTPNTVLIRIPQQVGGDQATQVRPVPRLSSRCPRSAFEHTWSIDLCRGGV